MELSRDKKKIKIPVKVRFKDILDECSLKFYIWYNIAFLLCCVPAVIGIITYGNRKAEIEAFSNKYCKEETKEYIVIGKEQISHSKSSTDLVFLIRCIETGVSFDITVNRSTYLSKGKGDHVWFTFPKYRFMMSESRWECLDKPTSLPDGLIFTSIALFALFVFYRVFDDCANLVDRRRGKILYYGIDRRYYNYYIWIANSLRAMKLILPLLILIWWLFI